MSAALEIFLARATREEGVERFAYNDKTGKRVTCRPDGNLSIGKGVNLEVGLDDEEIEWLLRHRAEKVERQLMQFQWYTDAAIDPVRQSVPLDAAFNMGLERLLHFPHFLAHFAMREWEAAAAELHVSEEAVDQQRYAPLRALLINGGAGERPATGMQAVS